MGIKIGLVSLGCSKNQVDAERMLSTLVGEGFELCNDAALCDAVVINTCGFIEDAKRESIEAILEFCNMKGSKLRAVAVTGCLAERYREQLAAEIPEVDVVLGIGSNQQLGDAIKAAIAGRKTLSFEEKTDLSLEGDRIIINQPYFAYLKVAEGCDNRCCYCAIPDIRGKFRSRKMEDILDEAKKLAAAGVVELNVVAQDTTRYGEDLYGKLMLPELLRELCKIEEVRWIRLLYCYPDRVTDELIEMIATEPKIVKYIDMPLQHINDGILKSMNRRGDSKLIKEVLQKLRDRIEGVAVRTTFIVGLPGEGEAEFEELCKFVDDCGFERLGCFAYSPEEGTPAFGMEDQVEDEVKRRRADAVMELQMGIAESISKSLIGRQLTVLCEGYDEESGCFIGRSYMDAPDIDTRVYFRSKAGREAGEFVEVIIESASGYDVNGIAVE